MNSDADSNYELKDFEYNEEFNILDIGKSLVSSYNSHILNEKNKKEYFKGLDISDIRDRKIDDLSYKELVFLNDNIKYNFNFVYPLALFNSLFLYYSYQFIKHKSHSVSAWLSKGKEKNFLNMTKYSLVISSTMFLIFGLGNYISLYNFNLVETYNKKEELKHKINAYEMKNDINCQKTMLIGMLNYFQISEENKTNIKKELLQRNKLNIN